MPTQLSIMDIVLGHRTHRYNKQISIQTCTARYICIFIYVRRYILYMSKQQQLNLLIRWLVASIDGIDGVGRGHKRGCGKSDSLPIDTCHIRNATSKSFVTRRLRRTNGINERTMNQAMGK